MNGIVGKIAASAPLQILITLVTYSFYAAVIGLSLFPSVTFLIGAWNLLLPFAGGIRLVPSLLFSLAAGASVYIYFIAGVIVMGLLIRVISLGIRPGCYPRASSTVLRWLIYSGIYTLAVNTILPLIPVTFFSNLFFRIIGCRIGKNVYLNTWILNDAYLLEIEDDVILGGSTDISCHLWENDHLILQRVKIGRGTLVGAHCYVSPGVTIGKRCVIGLGSFIRRGKTIPDGTVTTSLSGLPMKDMIALEKRIARDRNPPLHVTEPVR